MGALYLVSNSVTRAEIICVGDEVLRGEVVNSNAAWIGRALMDTGFIPSRTTVCRDEINDIHAALKSALERVSIVIMTGGLGPTPDDLTLDAIASYYGLPLEEDAEMLAHVESFFKARGVAMPAASRNQARFPVGALHVPNDLGTASGVQVIRDGKHLFVLPGVHAEMKAMFAAHVVPRLCDAFPPSQLFSKVLKLADIGESQILQKLAEGRGHSSGQLAEDVDLAFYPHHGMLDIRMTAHSADTHEAETQIAHAEAAIRDAAGKHVYGSGGRSLAETIGAILLNRQQTLTVAESCTGGLLMNLLTDIPGASNWFERGFVTYSNAAKISELGVAEELITKHGAVSEEVAKAMASGAREQSGAAWGLGITGIAGPDGGSAEKPVGTVWIAVSSEQETRARLYRLGGERAIIKLRAAHSALFNLWRRLMEE